MVFRIKQISLDAYSNCSAIWNMQTCPYTDMFIEQIKAGNREVFVLTVDDEYTAECDLVYDNPEYGTFPGERLYFSRLIVKRPERGKGYGEVISQCLLNKAKERVISLLLWTLTVIILPPLICIKSSALPFTKKLRTKMESFTEWRKSFNKREYYNIRIKT